MGTINSKNDGNNNNITISKGSAPPRKVNTLTGETDRSYAQPNPTSAVEPIEPKAHASVVDEERAIRENSQKEKEQATQHELEAKRARTAKTRQEDAAATKALEEAALKAVEEEAARKAVQGSRTKTTGDLPQGDRQTKVIELGDVEVYEFTDRNDNNGERNDNTTDD